MGIQLTDLLIKECITIDTTLNFDIDFDGHSDGNVMCKQTFKGTAFGQFVCPH